MGFFASLGFPGFLAPVVGVVEVAAGVLLLIGLWHRYAAYALSVIIAVAILRVQLPAAISAGDLIVPFARDVLLLAALLVIAFHGPGCCAVDSKRDDRKRR